MEVLHPREPGQAPAETVITAPAPAEGPAFPEEEVTVTMASDKALKPRHPSKLAAAETLEDRSVVLVDELTLERLGVKDGGAASLGIPGGRVAQVTLQKMELLEETGRFVVVPRKV